VIGQFFSPFEIAERFRGHKIQAWTSCEGMRGRILFFFVFFLFLPEDSETHLAKRSRVSARKQSPGARTCVASFQQRDHSRRRLFSFDTPAIFRAVRFPRYSSDL